MLPIPGQPSDACGDDCVGGGGGGGVKRPFTKPSKVHPIHPIPSDKMR